MFLVNKSGFNGSRMNQPVYWFNRSIVYNMMNWDDYEMFLNSWSSSSSFGWKPAEGNWFSKQIDNLLFIQNLMNWFDILQPFLARRGIAFPARDRRKQNGPVAISVAFPVQHVVNGTSGAGALVPRALQRWWRTPAGGHQFDADHRSDDAVPRRLQRTRPLR